MKRILSFLLILVISQHVEAQSIASDRATLKVINNNNKYGIRIQLSPGEGMYEQLTPMAVEVVNNAGNSVWVTDSYTAVEIQTGNVLNCLGTIKSANGSVFTFIDKYQPYDSTGTFELKRSVKVTSVDSRDMGFSTRVAFQRNVPSTISAYDFFVPSVWYKDNKDVSPNALASDLTDNDYWFREDRLPLPIVMLRQKDNGITFSMFHKDADGATFKEENGLTRVIDDRMKFASMGLQNNQQPLVGMLYPGTEGERTGVLGMVNSRRWAYRSHPVRLNFVQDYGAAFRLNQEDDYLTALKNTWNSYLMIQNPAFYQVDLNKVYTQHIDILDKYWRSINNSAGVPFRIKVSGEAVDADYNWNMGFVGQEIPNAALMLREALKTDNTLLRVKAEQMVDFWADESLADSGIPRTWYDPYPQTWRQMATHLRTVGDGMNGLLWAWNFEKRKGIDKKTWLRTAAKVADWLVNVQNADGSFYQQYDFNNSMVVNDTKNNTSNIVPFLVDIYNITGKEKYKQAALKAGDFIYTDVYQNFKYAGGAADNPNIPDKEAVSMALRAFLALYDLSKENLWVDASKQAAYYYQTWVYTWSVPIPSDDVAAIFPKNRDVTGLSAIATGNNAADTYAAIDAFNIYRVYQLSGDQNLFNFSKLLLLNTKQYVNWDQSNPISGFALGFMGEALTILIPRGRGVDYYLPWQTFNLLEPMVLFEDVLESYDINTIQNLSSAERKAKLDAYSINRGFEKGSVVE